MALQAVGKARGTRMALAEAGGAATRMVKAGEMAIKGEEEVKDFRLCHHEGGTGVEGEVVTIPGCALAPPNCVQKS